MTNRGQVSPTQYVAVGLGVIAIIISIAAVVMGPNTEITTEDLDSVKSEADSLSDEISSLGDRITALEQQKPIGENEEGEERGSLTVKGSTTVLPIATDAAEAWMEEHPNDEISVSGGGTGGGIQALIDGTTDIADASRPIKESEGQAAKDAGVNLVEHSIARGAVCVVASPNNPVDELTIEQARKVFAGEITNWGELGWSDGGEIQVYHRESGSGTRETFVEGVMGTKKVTPKASIKKSNGATRQATSQNNNAIAYVGLGYVDDSIKAIKLNGVKPSKETVANGDYKITRTLFMYTDGEPTGLAKEFINYVKNATEIINNNGFIPLSS